MTIVKFLLGLSLVLVMLAEKLIFYRLESEFANLLIAKTELVFLIGMTIWGAVCFFKEEKNLRPERPKEKLTKLQISLLTVILLLVSFTFALNVTKDTLDWDSIALYDARARFLLEGVSFSEMPQLSKFDYKNGYYYLLYPPFTSLIHFSWYKLGVPLPVSVTYSLFLVLLVIGTFSLVHRVLGATWSLFLITLVISQENLYTTALVAYTNLPYTLYVSLGIFLIYNHLLDRKNWEMIFGILLLSVSQWVRFLEPSWFAVWLALFVTSFMSKRKKYLLAASGLFAVLGVMEYGTWRYFVDYIGNNETIFQSSPLSFIEPVVGVFTGSLLTMCSAYFHMWGNSLLLYFAALVPSTTKRIKSESIADLFLKLCIFFSFCMYLAGLYFISFQVDWWPEMGGSLVRSSTYLLPIGIYLVVKNVKYMMELNKK